MRKWATETSGAWLADVPDDFLRTVWTNALQPHVPAIIAGQTEGSLDSASHIAEKICEDTPRPTTASNFPSTLDVTARLLEWIDERWRQVSALQASQKQSPVCHSPPTLAHQRSPRQHHRQTSAAPRQLLVPLAVRGRSPKMHPTVLPLVEGIPPSE